MANSMKSLIKTGFGLGFGVIGAQLVFIFVGALLFIPGYILYTRDVNKGNKGSSEQVMGIVLMGFGCLLMLGLGFGVLLDSVSDML
jgi:hypothetical protein